MRPFCNSFSCILGNIKTLKWLKPYRQCWMHSWFYRRSCVTLKSKGGNSLGPYKACFCCLQKQNYLVCLHWFIHRVYSVVNTCQYVAGMWLMLMVKLFRIIIEQIAFFYYTWVAMFETFWVEASLRPSIVLGPNIVAVQWTQPLDHRDFRARDSSLWS